MLPDWWFDELRAKVADDKIEKTQLGKELSALVGRARNWDHKAVDRFLKNDVTTHEMMVAFLRRYPSLMQPVFVARSRLDAERMLDVLRRGDPNPEWKNRYMEIDDAVIELEREIADQTEQVTSPDGEEVSPGKSPGGRARRVDRSGT